MKETTKTSRIAGQLEKMFRTINNELFGGEVEEPIITIQSTPNAYGHVTTTKEWVVKDKEAYELNISADFLKRPIEELCATLIHEMTHLINMQRGIQDCSRGNTYHNRKFKEEAEKHLIKISKDEKYGWTITEPTEELLDFIIDHGWEEILASRNWNFAALFGTGSGSSGSGNGTPTAKPPKPKGKTRQSYRKHVCPSCGLIARTTKDATLICGNCQEEMEIED